MGYVYLLKADIKSRRFAHRSIYKIGMTDRPVHIRFTEIQQEWLQKRRIKVTPVKAIAVREPYAVEAHFHRIFKAQRLYGKEMANALGGGSCSGDSEWFDGTVEKPALREFDRYSVPVAKPPQLKREVGRSTASIGSRVNVFLLLAVVAIVVLVLILI